MNNRPLHENLDTSFVNLSGLLKYLRRRQFDGSIRIELSGYEADIYLTANNEIKVREYDQIAGRIAEGEQALQRILIRSREPGGIIHVYQNVPDEKTAPLKAEPVVKEVVKEEERPVVKIIPAPAVSNGGGNGNGNGNGYAAKPHANGNGNGNGQVKPPKPEPETKHEFKSEDIETETETAEAEKKSANVLPDFPFELSNRFEEKARKTQLSAADWQMLLNLSAELLRTVDNALANADLDFTGAFKKACTEISADYPFFAPDAKVFAYQGGKVRLTEQISPKLYVAGINSSLRRIFDKLSRNPKFTDTYRYTVQQIVELIRNRKQRYDKFSITPQLERIIGV